MKYTIAILTVTITALIIWYGNIRASDPFTNIKGIPFPQEEGTYVITERLAHTDLYLDGSRFAKNATITLEFSPHTTKALHIGIRENAFWLSYPWQTIYRREGQATHPVEDAVTTTITIPLTDKLPDKDNSFDLMIFAEGEVPEPPDSSSPDATLWELHNISTLTKIVWPDWSSIKDYVRSTVKRERPL